MWILFFFPQCGLPHLSSIGWGLPLSSNDIPGHFSICVPYWPNNQARRSASDWGRAARASVKLASEPGLSLHDDVIVGSTDGFLHEPSRRLIGQLAPAPTHVLDEVLRV